MAKGSSQKSPKRILLANSWWHEDIVKGIVKQAACRRWHVDLRTIFSGQLPHSWDGDGIITMLGCNIDQLKRLIKQTGCPAVSLNANYPELEIPRVTQDDSVTGKIGAQHFLERGFTNFAYYSHGPSPTTDTIRHASFDAALRASGHTAHHIAWQAPYNQQAKDSWGERQTWLKQELSSLHKPLAVLATNDQAAAEVIEACLSDGVTVPDEVAVLGVLDMPIFRESTTIPLSSVTVNHDKAIGIAFGVLADMMEGGHPPASPILIPPTGIAARRSTDIIAAKSTEVKQSIRFILDNYAEPINVSELERASGVCKTLLYEAFKRDLGKSPGTVLSEIRIQKAKRLLLDTSEKIRAISESCGFGDPVNLYRQFKKRVGTSPAEYRRREKTDA